MAKNPLGIRVVFECPHCGQKAAVEVIQEARRGYRPENPGIGVDDVHEGGVAVSAIVRSLAFLIGGVWKVARLIKR